MPFFVSTELGNSENDWMATDKVLNNKGQRFMRTKFSFAGNFLTAAAVLGIAFTHTPPSKNG